MAISLHLKVTITFLFTQTHGLNSHHKIKTGITIPPSAETAREAPAPKPRTTQRDHGSQKVVYTVLNQQPRLAVQAVLVPRNCFNMQIQRK